MSEWPELEWHLCVVLHAERDGLQKAFGETGFWKQIRYPTPPHLQMAYRDAGYARGRFPISESMANRLLSLPKEPQLDDVGVARLPR